MIFKNIQSKDWACFWTTTVVLLVCLILISVYSGFVHESQKFRTMMVTLILVLFFQFLIYEPLRFLVLAIDHATWPQEETPYKAEKGMPTQNNIAYLKVRLRSLRSELLITEGHRNEALNQRYKHITGDLVLYGLLFLTLMVIVVMQADQYHYYNTYNMQRLFWDNTTETFGLSQIYLLYQIHNFLRITMVEAFFNPNAHYGWWAIEQWQKIGVLRLRQVRAVDTRIGLGEPRWDDMTYAPEWRLPYQRMHYTDKFWRIYDPFRPAKHEPSFLNGLLLNFDHHGALHHYPELGGYVVLMMSTKTNCLKQLDYLRKYNWLNQNTSALFIDFTMYNADANAFTVLTLRIENSPFGTQIPRVHVDSVRMLATVEMKTKAELFVMFVYAILVIQFARGVIKKIWYDPGSIRQAWTIVDLTICILNVFLLGLSMMRDIETSSLLEMIETFTKGQYLDFQRPLRLHQFLDIVKGFLVCITTMRLWKVLQFAAVFQHFTQTLFSAWRAVASLGVIILVLLMGIGIALAVPNGNNAVVFHHLIKAVVTCLWYSVGYNGGIRPTEFFYGGFVLGILLYLVLVFLLAIILLNVFASVIYDYFHVTGRDLKEHLGRKHISFLEFLRIEYGDVCRRCFRCLRRKYQPSGRTVAQNVERALKEQELDRMQKRRRKSSEKRLTNEERQADYLRRGERMFKLMAILNLQVEILECLMLGDKDGNLPTPPESDSDPEDMPEMYRRRPSIPR
ncbi:polycystic kidney disease protein 1-like 3 [Drosophila elegans]|uniref:polycystic kidney disease protein 1-like 3 n=1 Tax=Drosophila elegans TaxID=30023 RepID=UPI0007E7FC9C|nr:polycystic kidney disease protein 1-like 3 [Drosophila elegans]